MHIALGGCLSARGVRYGLTEDTGGHIAYVLGAVGAQAARDDVARVDIVTRAFDLPGQPDLFSQPYETLTSKSAIIRLTSARRDYLEKSDLLAELPSLKQAFLTQLRHGPRPDVIHAHFADAAELAADAKATFGIPWVFSSHSLGLQKGGTGAGHQARIARETRAVAGADAIIASSRDEAERQIAAYDAAAAGRTHRISPGVRLPESADADRARALIRPFLTTPFKPILLAISRPVEKKNLRALIEAYAAAPRLQERVNLVILAGLRTAIGDDRSETGRVTTELFDLVDRHDLWGRVALPRQHDEQDVASLYALASKGGAFVNPAHHEPFGLTVIEALQAGVPVVATRNGGPAESLETAGYGRLVDPRDTQGIAEACLSLLTDPDRARQTMVARRKACAAYSWTGWAESVQEVYSRIGGRKPHVAGHPSRLLVSDMDGTLTGDEESARHLPRLLDILGIELVVATGRPISEARRVLSMWNIPEPDTLIASVGSEVWHRGERGAYVLDRDYATAISGGWDAQAIVALADGMLQPQAPYEQRRWKLSYVGGADRAADFADLLRRKGIKAHVIASHGRFIDVLPPAAGKGAAAAHVAALRGLSAADCMAAGDSGNDTDLLSWAGTAILPANALAELGGLSHPALIRSRMRHALGVADGVRAALTTGRGLKIAAE